MNFKFYRNISLETYFQKKNFKKFLRSILMNTDPKRVFISKHGKVEKNIHFEKKSLVRSRQLTSGERGR